MAGVPVSIARNGRCRKRLDSGMNLTSDVCVHFGNFGVQIQVYFPVSIPGQASGQGAACPATGKGVTPQRETLFLTLIAQ
jgi:hypothetical protein